MTLVFLLVTLVVLLGIVFYLTKTITTQKKNFETRIATLQQFIIQLSEEQKKQNNQLVLSDDLKQKIVAINQSISQDLYDLNFELFASSFPKKNI